MRRKKKDRRSYSVAGVEVLPGGRSFSWSGNHTWKGGEKLPAERCFAWHAEALGLHLWIDHPPEIGRKVGGWFSAGRVSTIRVGDRYCFSASRWLADPLERADDLLKFAGELQAGCGSLGINLKGSPGSAAVELYSNLIHRAPKIDFTLNEFAEGSIYGGRAELFWGGPSDCLSQWDRSAAYLAHLQEALPVPGTERWTGTANLECEGITEAIVEADPNCCPIPCLPAHVELSPGEQRTVFGWGRFHGKWPNVELRAARERGYRIRPLGGVVFQRMQKNATLQRFVERVWTARAKFPLAKRIGLALVGKFHEPRTSRIVQPGFGPFRSLREMKLACLKAGPGAIPVHHAHVILPLQRRENFSWYVNMALASHVLALGRLELLRFAEANITRLCTLATDGAILAGLEKPSGVSLGKCLGQWRLDYEADQGGVIHGPLAYRLRSSEKADKVRTAGVSRALAMKFLKGETVRWTSRASLLARGYAGVEVKRRANARDFSGELRRDEKGHAAPPLVQCVRLPGGEFRNHLVDEDTSFPFPSEI